jgi:hypothetical protein
MCITEQTILSNEPDRRNSPFTKSLAKLTPLLSTISWRQGDSQQTRLRLWNNATPRVQLFIWLLVKGRIQCGSNLFRKNIVDAPGCVICVAPQETPEHIVFDCHFAVDFWEAVGLQIPQGQRTQNLQMITSVPQVQFSSFVALCCWQLWKRRNGVVFRNEALSLRQLALSCKAEAKLWRARMQGRRKRYLLNGVGCLIR